MAGRVRVSHVNNIFLITLIVIIIRIRNSEIKILIHFNVILI